MYDQPDAFYGRSHTKNVVVCRLISHVRSRAIVYRVISDGSLGIECENASAQQWHKLMSWNSFSCSSAARNYTPENIARDGC
jgi:hypothetical protein